MSPLEARAAALPPDSADIVLNALPHPVLMVDGDGKIADANVAAEAFFEVSMPLLRRHALRDLVPFGSPLLALIEQVRVRNAPVNEYRVDLSTPRNPGERVKRERETLRRRGSETRKTAISSEKGKVAVSPTPITTVAKCQVVNAGARPARDDRHSEARR